MKRDIVAVGFQRITSKEAFLAFLLIGFFWFFLFLQTELLFSGFHFIDDHQIIEMSADVEKNGILDSIKKWLIVDFNVNRFRPVYYVHRVLKTFFFGTNWDIWHTYNAAMAVVSTFSLFLFARLIKLSFVESLVLVALIFLGEQSVIWWRLGPAETLGTLFLSLSLLFIGFETSEKSGNRKKALYVWLTVFFLMLASLCKESFIISIPFIVALRIWLVSVLNQLSLRESFQQCLKSSAAMIVIMVGELLYIKNAIGLGGTGYAGIDESTFDWGRFYSTATALAQKTQSIFLTIICLSLITIILFWSANHSRKKYNVILENNLSIVVAPILILAVGIIPQILLYTKSGISAFYLVPSAVFLSLFTLGIVVLTKRLSKLSYVLALIIIGLNIVGKFDKSWQDFRTYAQEGVSTTALFQGLEGCTDKNDEILIVLNPRTHFELSHSLKIYLEKISGRENLLIRSYGLDGSIVFSDTFADAEKAWSFIDPRYVIDLYGGQTLETLSEGESVEAIVILSPFRDEFLENEADWFSKDGFLMDEYILNYMGGSVSLFCQL